MATPTLTESLYEYMAAPGYEPQELAAISKGLGLHPSQRSELKAALSKGLIQGKLIKLRKSLYMLRKPMGGELTGRISQRGSRIFFVPDADSATRLASLSSGEPPASLYIAPYASKGAMDGDKVEVSVRVKAPQRNHRNRHSRSTLHAKNRRISSIQTLWRDETQRLSL